MGHVYLRAFATVVVALALAGCPRSAKENDRFVKFDDRIRVEGVDNYMSIYAYRTNSGEFRFSLGLTSPIHLLSYRDAATFPSYCRREQILLKLEELARGRGCDVVATDVDGAKTRLITCKLQGGPSDACPSSYVAQIWQERWPDSTEDYELDMYARVRSVCAREKDFGTFHASDDVTAAAEKQSDDVTNLLASCQTTGANP